MSNRQGDKSWLREWVTVVVTVAWTISVALAIYDSKKYPVPVAIQVIMGIVAGWLFNTLGRDRQPPV